jgi:hypothetical protein
MAEEAAAATEVLLPVHFPGQTRQTTTMCPLILQLLFGQQLIKVLLYGERERERERERY